MNLSRYDTHGHVCCTITKGIVRSERCRWAAVTWFAQRPCWRWAAPCCLSVPSRYWVRSVNVSRNGQDGQTCKHKVPKAWETLFTIRHCRRATVPAVTTQESVSRRWRAEYLHRLLIWGSVIMTHGHRWGEGYWRNACSYAMGPTIGTGPPYKSSHWHSCSFASGDCTNLMLWQSWVGCQARAGRTLSAAHRRARGRREWWRWWPRLSGCAAHAQCLPTAESSQ